MNLAGIISEDSREREGNIILGEEEKTIKKIERAASGKRGNAWVCDAGKAGKEGQSGQTYLRLDHLQENFTGFGNVKSIGELSKSNSAECGKGV